MTTNIYENLCDRVGAYTTLSNGKKQFCSFKGNCEFYPDADSSIPCEQLGCQYAIDKAYPPQSAEQILKLIKLILSKRGNMKIGISDFSKDLTSIEYIFCSAYDSTCENEFFGDIELVHLEKKNIDFQQCFYTLTHELFKQGILNAEEIKGALNGN